jgi:predicted phage terminase large subunit-like protein
MGLATLASNRLYSYAPHLALLNYKLFLLANGKIKRLMVFMPPRHGKSELCSKYFPAWFIGRYAQRILLTSYEASFASTWGRLSRNTLTEYGPSVFGVRVSQDSSAADHWELEGAGGQRGVMVTAGVGGAITGKGASCFPAGTRIATEYGPIAIERLCALQYQVRVWAFDHEAQRPVLRRIVAAREIASSDLVEVTTTSGRRIRATADHRFYVPGVGYRAAALLRRGDDLQSIRVTKQQDLRDMRPSQERSRCHVPGVLSARASADRQPSMCPMRRHVRASAVSARTRAAARMRRRLLLQRLLTGASRDQTRQGVRLLRAAYAGQPQPALLLGSMPGGGAATAHYALSLLRDDLSSGQPPHAILHTAMRQRRSLRAYARQGQFALQDRHELREVVRGYATSDSSARQATLPRLPDAGTAHNGDVARPASQANQSRHSPYQRESNRQHAREPRDALQGVSCDTPQVERDAVAVVRHLRAGSVSVYDLQVEECHNFFAEGVLAHNCLIIDDPVKNMEEANSATLREKAWSWYTSTAYTRLEPEGRILVIQTRWHHDDLSGRILDRAKEELADGEPWHVLSLPAIAEGDEQYDIPGAPSPFSRKEGEPLWPDRFSAERLAKIRSDVGSSVWTSLYQQRPSPEAGMIWRAEWFKRYRELPEISYTIQTVDSAFKTTMSADYSVIATWGKTAAGFYLLDLWRARVEFPDLKRAVVDQYNKNRPYAIYIEDKASGQSAIQELRRETNLPILAYESSDSKIARAQAVSPLAEAGKVYVPAEAPWVADWLDEHAKFPNGSFDDQVDTSSMALEKLRDGSGITIWDDF